MKKDVFGKGKVAAAAAGLALAFAVGATGCAAGSKAESGSAREAAATSEEGGADVQKNSQGPETEESREAKLSEYTPVDRLPWQIAQRRISCLKTWETV